MIIRNRKTGRNKKERNRILEKVHWRKKARETDFVMGNESSPKAKREARADAKGTGSQW